MTGKTSWVQFGPIEILIEQSDEGTYCAADSHLLIQQDALELYGKTIAQMNEDEMQRARYIVLGIEELSQFCGG